MKALMDADLEVYVARSYDREKLTLREAADLLNLTLIEAIDLFGEMGIKGNIRAKDAMDGLRVGSTRE